MARCSNASAWRWRLARQAAAEGFTGAALKLGHDLWQSHVEPAAAMLELAYDALDRKLLRGYLARAVAFRARCDAARP